MELKYFRLIKTIVEEGNLASSSEKLFLTQSALSHQLRELESRLGFKVFYRQRKQWTLTKEGTQLYEMATKLEHTLADGFSTIQAIQEGTAGSIKFSVECQSFLRGIPAFVQKMGLLYPNIDIQLSIGCGSGAENLLTDSVDICLVTNYPKLPALNATFIFEDEIFAIVHQENPIAKEPYLQPHHFKDVHLIINSYPLESVAVHALFLHPAQMPPKRISAISFTEVSLEMVKANMGVITCPKWSLAAFDLPSTLALVPIGQHGLRRKHYLLCKTADRYKSYMQDFIDNFQDEMLTHHRSFTR